MKANQPSPPYRLIRSWNLMNGRISLFALFLLFLFTGTIAFLGTRQVRARALAAEAPALTQAEIAAFVQSATPRGPEGEAQIFIAPGREPRSGKPFPFEIDGEDIGSRDIGRRLQHLDEGAESNHFKGLFQLRKAWRETGLKAQYFREAEQLLIAALEAEPERASAWNDLGAVYLSWAAQLDRPRLYLDAYAATHAALSLDEDLAEARFNQASAMEKLGLFQQAAAALEKPWPSGAELGDVEARRARLENLDPVTLQLDFVRDLESAAEKRDRKAFMATASRYPPAAGRWVEEKLLPRWAESAEANGVASVEPWLAMARGLGELIAVPANPATYPDEMLRDTVAVIDDALARLDDTRLKRLIAGHTAFGRGMQLFLDRDDFALIQFQESATKLAAARSPFSERANFQRGACLHLQRDLAGAMSAFADEIASGDLFPGLGIRIGWGRGLIFNQLDRLREALDVYEPASLKALKMGDLESVAALAYQEAEAESVLGNLDPAWRHLAAALQIADYPQLARYRVNIFFTAADLTTARRDDLPESFSEGLGALQLLFQEQAVAAADRSGIADLVVQNRSRFALLLRDKGKEAEANVQLRYATALLEKVAHTERRERLRAELLLAHASGEDSLVAEHDLEEALRIFGEQELPYREVQAMAELADRANSRGDREVGEAWLDKAQLQIEQLASRLEPMRDRSGYLAALKQVFRKRIIFALDYLRSPEKALEFHLREQQLLRRAMRPDSAPEGDAPADLPRIPADSAFIVWLELDKGRLIALVATPNGVWSQQLLGVADDLRRSTAELRATVKQVVESPSSGGDEKLESQLAKLNGRLIEPIEELLKGASRLGMSLDDAYSGVPFEALTKAPGAPRLVERFLVIRVADPAALAQEPTRLDFPAKGALVVAAGKPAAIWGLQSLEGPDKEVAALVEAIPLAPSNVLAGAEATRQHVLAGLPSARWLHFAGHALADPYDPSPSLLILADDPGEPTALSVADLASAGAGHLEMAVLAGCDTAVSGTAGLAQALERGGVSVTIGSQWPVGDETTAIFFRDFYQLLAEGVPPVQALHETQVAASRTTDPTVWAAFVAWGW